jgi:hypothetical protein
MRERILFVIAILFVIGITIIEARQDYWIITSGATMGKWKLWGNAYNFGWILTGSLVLSYLSKRWTIILWIPILWLVWWMTHDTFIGIFLTDNPLYVGVGEWDQYFARIFQQSGGLYLGVRMFWTLLMILGYLRFERENLVNVINEYTSNDPVPNPLLPPGVPHIDVTGEPEPENPPSDL